MTLRVDYLRSTVRHTYHGFSPPFTAFVVRIVEHTTAF